MILDHIGITVADAARCRAFYSAALAPLDISLVMDVQGWLLGPATTEPPLSVRFITQTITVRLSLLRMVTT